MRIIPPSRPNRDFARLDAVRRFYDIPKERALLIFVRSYYLDTMGAKGKGDINIYDDACFLMTPNVIESWNANTEPSAEKKGSRLLFTMALGKYKYYKGQHKGKYLALRPYPEGVVLKGTRGNKPSTGSHTNIHKGGSIKSFDVTWSEGCLTIPNTQWADFQTRVYKEMTLLKQSTIDVVIVENRNITGQGQKWVDSTGGIIT